MKTQTPPAVLARLTLLDAHGQHTSCPGVTNALITDTQAKSTLLASVAPATTPDNSASEALGSSLMMSIKDAFREARIGRTKIYAEIGAGRLRAVKLGRRTLIRRSDFEAWIAALPQMKGAR